MSRAPYVCYRPHGAPIKEEGPWGAWVAQSVKHPTSTQVTISRSMGSSPARGSELTARSLEPASRSVSPSLSAPSPALFLSKINKTFYPLKKKKKEGICPWLMGWLGASVTCLAHSKR